MLKNVIKLKKKFAVRNFIRKSNFQNVFAIIPIVKFSRYDFDDLKLDIPT